VCPLVCTSHASLQPLHSITRRHNIRLSPDILHHVKNGKNSWTCWLAHRAQIPDPPSLPGLRGRRASMRLSSSRVAPVSSGVPVLTGAVCDIGAWPRLSCAAPASVVVGLATALKASFDAMSRRNDASRSPPPRPVLPCAPPDDTAGLRVSAASFVMCSRHCFTFSSKSALLLRKLPLAPPPPPPPPPPCASSAAVLASAFGLRVRVASILASPSLHSV